MWQTVPLRFAPSTVQINVGDNDVRDMINTIGRYIHSFVSPPTS